MLIRANDLLRDLEKRRLELMEGTFRVPPPDYATFMRAVGQFQENLALESIVRELSRKADDE